MNKAELVAALEGRLGSKRAAAEALEAVVDTITRTVARGEKVAITGFGSFEKTVRNARVGRNPRTGETVKIKKTSVPRFRPGTAFKGYVSDPRSLPKAVPGAVRAVAGTSGSAVRSPAKAVTSRGVARPAASRAAASPAPRSTTARATAAKTTAAKTTAAKTTAAKTTAAKTTAAAPRTAARKVATPAPTPARRATTTPVSETAAMTRPPSRAGAKTGAAPTVKAGAKKTAKDAVAKSGKKAGAGKRAKKN